MIRILLPVDIFSTHSFRATESRFHALGAHILNTSIDTVLALRITQRENGAPAGIFEEMKNHQLVRTRVLDSKGLDAGPDYTTGALEHRTRTCCY